MMQFNAGLLCMIALTVTDSLYLLNVVGQTFQSAAWTG